MQTALARRGVAVVALPGDVALREAVGSGPRLHFAERGQRLSREDELVALALLLDQAKKITILGGAVALVRHEELIELAGKLKAPIVARDARKEFIEYDNPFDVGMTGLLGFSSAITR